jgi:UDP-2,3-diacylglucosamine pyrophosphatase LpxH
VRWAAETWPATPVVYVLGNHEHYGSSIEATLARCRAAAAGSNVHVLERDAVTIHGVRILGATLWTDLALAGDLNFVHWRLGHDFPDYRAIESESGGRLRPAETIAIHEETVRWLWEALYEPHDGPTIVVTHHAPSPRALGQWDEWAGESPWTAMDAAFASDLELLIDLGKPDAWIHGHTHRSGEYRVSDTHLEATRVISNQRGYYHEASGWDPTYMLELDTDHPLHERRA